jgi:hypothetical protein
VKGYCILEISLDEIGILGMGFRVLKREMWAV